MRRRFRDGRLPGRSTLRDEIRLGGALLLLADRPFGSSRIHQLTGWNWQAK
jgi:hypothetical protein